MRIVLTTGGTGGHIFPALAVASELARLEPGCELLFVGSRFGPEASLAAKNGLPFHGLAVRGLLGRGVKALAAAFQMGRAVVEAYLLLRRFQADVIAGFGGYASFAPLLAARLLRVPSVLHEQNAICGTSNRFLGRFAARICTSLPETQGFPRDRCVCTGNPVRGEVVRAGRRQRDFSQRHLLILGGSQGAHALNCFICAHLEDFARAHISLCHQTGSKDEAWVREAYRAHGFDAACVSAFIDDMPAVYSWADLVFCRSGASTVAELCASGLPSVLVPFPFAIHDHQTKNAEVLLRAGCAEMLNESQLTDEALARVLRLMQSPDVLARMAEASARLARPGAAQEVAEVILAQSRTKLKKM